MFSYAAAERRLRPHPSRREQEQPPVVVARSVPNPGPAGTTRWQGTNSSIGERARTVPGRTRRARPPGRRGDVAVGPELAVGDRSTTSSKHGRARTGVLARRRSTGVRSLRPRPPKYASRSRPAARSAAGRGVTPSRSTSWSTRRAGSPDVVATTPSAPVTTVNGPSGVGNVANAQIGGHGYGRVPGSGPGNRSSREQVREAPRGRRRPPRARAERSRRSRTSPRASRSRAEPPRSARSASGIGSSEEVPDHGAELRLVGEAHAVVDHPDPRRPRRAGSGRPCGRRCSRRDRTSATRRKSSGRSSWRVK